MTKQKTMLITGANGFTGQHACHYFSQKNFHVIGTGRSEVKNIIEGSFLRCDLGNYQEIEDTVEKVQPELILHLAGKNSVADSWANPAENIHTNVMGTVHLLESIRIKAPNARTVVVGSTLSMPSLSSDPLHPYAVSKAMQILISRTWHQLFGLNIIVANPCNLIGPGASAGVCSLFAEKIAAMEIKQIPSVLQVDDLNQSRDFLDVRDAVRAYALLFEKGEPGEQYDLGTGNMRSLKTVVDIFQELANIPFIVQLKGNSSPSRADVLQRPKLDAIKNLGWTPAISFRQSAADILNYYRFGQKNGEA
ncbi:NAD-dependent epimerase/dehydratase family protein [Bacillota bacterium Lsc_1132]